MTQLDDTHTTDATLPTGERAERAERVERGTQMRLRTDTGGRAVFSSVGAAEDREPVRIAAVAYTGQPVRYMGHATVVDLDGLDLPGETARTLPMLLEHGWSFEGDHCRLGYLDTFRRTDRGLEIEGAVIHNGTAGSMLRDLRQGFPFEFSIGFDILEVRNVAGGESATVNGREVAGPVDVITRSRLREGSVVELGADADTSVALLSRGAPRTSTPARTPTRTTRQTNRGADAPGDTAMFNRRRSSSDDPRNAQNATDADRASFAETDDMTDEELASMILEKRPEAAKLIESGSHDEEHDDDDGELADKPDGGHDEQDKDKPSSAGMSVDDIAKLSAAMPGHAEVIIRHARLGLSATQSRALLADDAARASKSRRNAELAEQADGLEEPVRLGRRAAGASGGDRSAGRGGKAGFAGATGDNPEADWQNSAELRAACNDNHEAFSLHAVNVLTHAADGLGDGDYLKDVREMFGA